MCASKAPSTGSPVACMWARICWRYFFTYLSIFQKEIWHVRAVELWSRLGSGRCAGWDELKGGEFFSEDRFARVKPRLDFCQDIAEREMVQPF